MPPSLRLPFYALCLSIFSTMLLTCMGDLLPNQDNPTAVDTAIIKKSALISENGGSVQLPSDGAKLIVPPQSVSEDTEITIAQTTVFPENKNNLLIPMGVAFKCTPEGISFNPAKPPSLFVNYKPFLTAGINENTIRMYVYNEEMGEYMAVTSELDPAETTLKAELNHFSLYVPMAHAALLDPAQAGPMIQGYDILPGKIANQKLHVQLFIYDHNNLINPDTVNSIANVSVLWSVNGGAVQEETRAIRDRKTNDRYTFDIPADAITNATDSLTMTIIAHDNLNLNSIKHWTVSGGWDTIQATTYTLDPSSLRITGGFMREFQVRGRKVSNNQLVYLNPLSWEVIPETLGTFEGNVFTAGAAGSGTVKPILNGVDAGVAAVNVDAGEIKEIQIVDADGNPIPDDFYFIVEPNQEYAFGTVALDGHGSHLPVNSDWVLSESKGYSGYLDYSIPGKVKFLTVYALMNSVGSLCATNKNKSSCIKIIVKGTPWIFPSACSNCTDEGPSTITLLWKSPTASINAISYDLVYTTDGSEPTISNSIFIENIKTSYKGIYYYQIKNVPRKTKIRYALRSKYCNSFEETNCIYSEFLNSQAKTDFLATDFIDVENFIPQTFVNLQMDDINPINYLEPYSNIQFILDENINNYDWVDNLTSKISSANFSGFGNGFKGATIYQSDVLIRAVKKMYDEFPGRVWYDLTGQYDRPGCSCDNCFKEEYDGNMRLTRYVIENFRQATSDKVKDGVDYLAEEIRNVSVCAEEGATEGYHKDPTPIEDLWYNVGKGGYLPFWLKYLSDCLDRDDCDEPWMPSILANHSETTYFSVGAPSKAFKEENINDTIYDRYIFGRDYNLVFRDSSVFNYFPNQIINLNDNPHFYIIGERWKVEYQNEHHLYEAMDLSTVSQFINPSNNPYNVYNPVFASSGEHIYIVGGSNGSVTLKDVYVGNVNYTTGEIDDWIQLESLPVGLEEFTMKVLYNRLYIFGGNTSTLYSKLGVGKLNPSNLIYFADIQTNGTLSSWKQTSFPLPKSVINPLVDYNYQSKGIAYFGGVGEYGFETGFYFAKMDESNGDITKPFIYHSTIPHNVFTNIYKDQIDKLLLITDLSEKSKEINKLNFIKRSQSLTYGLNKIALITPQGGFEAFTQRIVESENIESIYGPITNPKCSCGC